MSWTIARIELSRPPGVSIRMIASGAPSSAASSSAEPIHFSVAGLIDASSSIEGTVVESPCAVPIAGITSPAASASQTIR